MDEPERTELAAELQTILNTVAVLNADHRQPSSRELCAQVDDTAARIRRHNRIQYLLSTGLLGRYAGLYVTEAGYEALKLAGR